MCYVGHEHVSNVSSRLCTAKGQAAPGTEGGVTGTVMLDEAGGLVGRSSPRGSCQWPVPLQPQLFCAQAVVLVAG